MRTIKTSEIKKIAQELLVKASFDLPEDIVEAIKKAKEAETSPKAVEMLDMILENAQLARKEKMPLCQDCGSVYIDISIGPDICIEQDGTGYRFRSLLPTLYDSLNDAVGQVYEESYLRRSIVSDPLFDRQNTGTNTPAIINATFSDIPGLGINVYIKGGGSENCSWLFMLDPSTTTGEIIDIVSGLVNENATKACPPVIIGIGIGSTSSEVAGLARKATFRNLGVRNSDPRYCQLEAAILERANKSGIGPQGLGGSTTALAVNIEFAPCHMATLPLAVFFGCHSTRRAGILI